MELFDIGAKVRIVLEPRCPQEWNLHMIYPYSKGVTGYIEGIEPQQKDGHVYRVGGLGIPGHPRLHMWFMPVELRALRPGNP